MIRFQNKRTTSRVLVAFLILLAGFLSLAGLIGLGPVHGAGFIDVSISHVPGVPKINDFVTFNGNWTGGTAVAGSYTYNFTWSFGDGSSNVTVTNLIVNSNINVTQQTQHQYLRAGSFKVGLTVCDSLCVNKGTRTITLSVRGALTTSFSYTPTTAYFGDSLTFTGTVSNGTLTPKGTYNYTFKWDFGDNTPTASVLVITSSLPAMSSITHNIRASGPVTFSLKVNDTFGQTGNAAQAIVIGGILGIDCGYGSSEAVINATGYPGADGANQHGNAVNPTLDTSCTWAGSPDIPFGGSQLQPLVSDNPTVAIGPGCCASPSQGGGFTAEIVYVEGGTSVVNGFDITVSWDPKILNAVEFDESGLPFSGANSFVASHVIDNSLGTAELSQALTSPPSADNVTLFRVRFDVVGIGTTTLSISQDSLIDTNLTPNSLPHRSVQGSFTSSNIPDLIAGSTLGLSVSWTFTPNPEVPGSPLTFVATASCTSCTLPLSYRWDTDSVQAYPANTTAATVEATGSSATITAPTAALFAHRVTLIVADAAGHIAEATRQLPLTVTPPASRGVAVNTPTSLTAEWLGGIPPYSGTTGSVGVKWSLCNSTGTTQTICTNPNPATNNQPGQINTVSNTYKWAGVFTGTVSVTDTAEPQIPSGPTTAGASFQVNVTGTPQVFTVALVTNATSGATVKHNVVLNATVAYNSNYPPPYRSSTFTYTIMFGDGNTTTLVRKGLAISIFHNFTSVATYSIIVIAQEAGSNSLAKIQETGFSQVSVFEPVTGSFSFTPGTVASGQSVTFTATGSGGQPPYSYSWNFGDGTTGTGSSVTHTYSGSGTYTVKLTVTDSGGKTFTSTQTVVATSSATTFYLELGLGIAVAAAAIVGLLFVRKRRRARISPEPMSPASPSAR